MISIDFFQSVNILIGTVQNVCQFLKELSFSDCDPDACGLFNLLPHIQAQVRTGPGQKNAPPTYTGL